MDLINVCGLLVIRYGYSSFTLLRKILDGITLGSLNMAANRDNSILMTLVGLSFSFFLQIGKFISLGLQKPKVTLLVIKNIIFFISISILYFLSKLLLSICIHFLKIIRIIRIINDSSSTRQYI